MFVWQREAKAGTGKTRESMEVNQKATAVGNHGPFVGGYVWVPVCPAVSSSHRTDMVERVRNLGCRGRLITFMY